MKHPCHLLLFLLLPWLISGCSKQSGTALTNTTPFIVEAAERGDIRLLDRLISDQTNVDARDACQWTPLMKAALNGRIQAVLSLLQEYVKSRRSGGETTCRT